MIKTKFTFPYILCTTLIKFKPDNKRRSFKTCCSTKLSKVRRHVFSSLHCCRQSLDEHLKIPCEKLHNKFLKICLGVHSKASNAAVRGEMGRFPLVVTIIKAMLNFWLHMVDIAEMNTLINAAMKEALLMEDVPGTWFYSCKQIYSLFGITWTGQAPCRQTFTSLINNIEKSYIAHWRNSLNSKDGREGKLSTYRKIKL